jgi:histidinol phosphatase-like enzyme (inositol monophosphatase family)
MNSFLLQTGVKIPMNYTKELTLALKTAEEAGAIQLDFARNLPAIELKDDHSPVTEVDRKCESLIRDRLLSAFPSDGFYGEESGPITGTSGRRWIVDPLDGTRPYLRGIPTYSVLIALEADGDPVVGVIHLPAMNSTCWASRINGAFLDGKPIHVSSVASFDKALGSAIGFVEKADLPEGERLFKLLRAWDYTYGFMDAFTYVCVASGKIDIAVSLLDKPWDCASAACIVREAGGVFSDIRGNASVYNGTIILSNGLLHTLALDFFN